MSSEELQYNMGTRRGVLLLQKEESIGCSRLRHMSDRQQERKNRKHRE